MLRSGRVAGSVAILVVCVVVAAVPSSAPASGSGIWTRGVEAVLPPSATGNVGMSSVSCTSAADCSAVGSYADGSYYGQGLLLSERSGAWASGVRAAMPAGSSGDPVVFISSVSCASAGDCSTVGYFDDSSGRQQGLLLSERSGRWTRGVEATLPANAASNPYVVISSVSCATAGNCAAVGFYVDRSGNEQGLLLSERSGRWAPGVEATLPGNAARGPSSWTPISCGPNNPCVYINSVSCSSAGECGAVGSYEDASGNERGLLLSERAGRWTRGVEATPPTNNVRNPIAILASVSCSSAGDCAAVGFDGSGGLLVSERSGRWTKGVEATPPAGAGNYVQVTSVSCVSPGNCAAVGYYYGRSNSAQGLLLDERSGRWARGVKATLPANADGDPIVAINSVSCASAGTCAAVGHYHDSPGTVEGLLLSESSGRWTRGVEASLPANAGSGPFVRHAELSSVSCTRAGACGAVGFYNDSSHNGQGLLLSGTLFTGPPHDTTITHATINGNRRTASFMFTAIGATSFQCALVKAKNDARRNKYPKPLFRACVTPKAYKALKHGGYAFEVRGINSAGAVDPNPAINKFTI